MKNIASTPFLSLLGASALLLFTTLAHAQYVWIDDKGIRHYSDRPPPPSMVVAKILKVPGKRQFEADEAPAEGTTPAEAPKAASRPTLAEREADYRKRAQERTKEESKAAAGAAAKQAQAENCASTRQYKTQLESGIRMAEMADNGERTFLSDDERAQRLNKVRASLAECDK